MAEVVVRSIGGIAQEVRARDHVLQADEPRELGGTDAGPSPYELLLAALGSCTAITLRLYAKRQGWPLDGIEIVLRHERVHIQDCQDCDSPNARLDRITKRLSLHGTLDRAQRLRLAEIAERCPVQRTLLGTMHIDQELVD
jgi:putative redox protein